MRARNKSRQKTLGESMEKLLQAANLLSGKDGKARHGRALMPVKGGRDTPDASFALRPFFQFAILELFERERWVRNHGMEGVRRAVAQPCQAVCLNHLISQLCYPRFVA